MLQEPVKPVAQELVNAIEPFVARQEWAMVQLQLLTAMRPGEGVMMRRGDLDTTVKVWIYTPSSHKTAYRGHKRRIYLGPQAQKTMLPFLTRPHEAYLFSPIEAEKERCEDLAAASTNEIKRVKKRHPKSDRTVGERDTRDSHTAAPLRGDVSGPSHRPMIWPKKKMRHQISTRLGCLKSKRLNYERGNMLAIGIRINYGIMRQLFFGRNLG